MSFGWPRFDEPVAIDEHRSWTATFESYNQRTDDVYYVITVAGGGRFMAEVSPRSIGGDDWTGPEFEAELRERIHAAALRGRTNTEYRGATFRNLDLDE